MAQRTLTRHESAALSRARRSVGARARRPGGGSRSATLDTARGLVIGLVAVLLLAGDPLDLPVLLRPADWNGFGVADLLPATVMTVVGVSLAHQIAARGRAGDWGGRWLRRIAVLTAVTLLLVVAGSSGGALVVRPTDPLLRVAIGGFAGWLVVTRTSPRTQAVLAGAAVFAHWWLLGRGDLADGGPAVQASALGRELVLYVDPDALVTLVPTMFAVVAGAAIGRWLRSRPAGPATAVAFGLAGIYTALAAIGWAQVLPVNATLWTAPTVLLGIGATLLVLSLSHLVVDVLGWGRAVRWVTALGMQALPAFAAASLLRGAREATPVGEVWTGLHDALAAPLLGHEAGMLALAAAATLLLARIAASATDRGIALRA